MHGWIVWYERSNNEIIKIHVITIKYDKRKGDGKEIFLHNNNYIAVKSDLIGSFRVSYGSFICDITD